MPTSKSDSIESLSLTLKTPKSAADAAAVASMLHAIVVLVHETKRELDTDTQIAIRVRPFTEGSLEIPFDLIVYGAGALLGFNAVVSQILKTIQQVVDLRKSLKGTSTASRLPEGEHTEVVNATYIENAVLNVNQNPQVNAALHQAFVDLGNDKEVTGVRLVDRTTGEELIAIEREEFPYFRYTDDVPTDDMPGDRVRGVSATLTIHSPVLAGKAKWKFIYDGLTISASMNDQTFLEKVRARAERFAAGDRLEVRLEIGEKYDEIISDYKRSGQYVVVRVLRHMSPPSPPKQQPLFTDEG